MRVRVARFKTRIRTGPESIDQQDFLNIMDSQMMIGVRPSATVDPHEICDGYFVGTIDAYYQRGPEGDLPGGETGEQYLIIRSPKTDRQTGEPLVTVVSMQNVADVEALSPAMAAKVYGADGQWMLPYPTRPILGAVRAPEREEPRPARARQLA
jgi:hypothetical protein